MMFDNPDDPNNGGGGGEQPGAGADPWSADELAQAQQWASQYYTSHKIPASTGNVQELVDNYQTQRRNGLGHQAAMDAVPGLLGWDRIRPNDDTPTTTTPPVPTPGPGNGSLITPFTEPYVPATPDPIPTLDIPKFNQPTMAEAMEDPGYKFTLEQGNNNLQNWAAARGTLNDSSTAKAMIDYGQGAATTQYGNVWDRAYNTWQTGTMNPALKNFDAQVGNVTHLNDVRWQDGWNKWLQDWNVFRDQRDSSFNHQFQVATA